MEKQEKLKRINDSIQNTMTSTIGIEITDIGDDFICGKMPVDERTTQPFGLLHGGASAALAETLGSIGGGIKVYSNNETVVGIEINANHLKSARDGWVYGKATPIRIGKKIQVWNIEITNEDDDLICVSRLTLAVIPKK
ncbi:MAG TPA: hotdog fold thioesterase [Candidatus Marinimicrobia bacterium]|jgi:1,4-dihydroxy-2-naphthoyl-CoA hydrolase|nr:hotdog fold thioesterase [Candidatus Neomarinimicrobiota bacterium]